VEDPAEDIPRFGSFVRQPEMATLTDPRERLWTQKYPVFLGCLREVTLAVTSRHESGA
jgi:hypothetical protein